jgi:hypothetical protein
MISTAPSAAFRNAERHTRIKLAVRTALAGALATGALAHAALPTPTPAASAGPASIITLNQVLVTARIQRH